MPDRLVTELDDIDTAIDGAVVGFKKVMKTMVLMDDALHLIAATVNDDENDGTGQIASDAIKECERIMRGE